MTDEERLPDPLALAKTMPVSWGMIFRHYGHADRRNLARQAVAICRSRGLACLVAGDWRLDAETCADGVHMPEALLTAAPQAGARLWCRSSRVFTSAAHGPSGLRLAFSVQVDAVFLSPVRQTKSHPQRLALGHLRFAALTRFQKLPVYGLGGLRLAHANTLIALGAAGIAGIGLGKWQL